MESKSKCQLDYLRQLYILDKIDDDKSWECAKVFEYYEDKGVDDSIQHTCLVEWNDINNSQSWVNFFALYLCNHTPGVSFVRDQKLLDKVRFAIEFHTARLNHQWIWPRYKMSHQARQLSSISLEFKLQEESRIP
jgi:hypothetical protein